MRGPSFSRIKLRSCLAVGLVAAVAASATSPATARVTCKGIFQVTKNGLISTPYCQDQQIARVARSYGWRVSDSQVRNDPLKKVRICQALGGDVRLKGACGAYSSKNFW